MTKSMTAFARAEFSGGSWEIRSVNQRYLDVNFKIPESVRFLEPALRESTKKHLDRGKLDCMLRIDTANDVQAEFEINQDVLNQLKIASEFVSSDFPNSRAPTTLDVLAWPGVIVQTGINREALGQAVSEAFTQALHSLIEMRAREGAELAKMIDARLLEITHIVTKVRSQVKVLQERQQQKIRTKIQELKVDVDTGRLEQELVYQAQKSDVAEELDRLDTHIEEVRKGLESSKPVGRRLDFLMQELNREANTLSSKAIAADTTIASVELKVMIEQMREQVQNIE